MRCRGVVEHRVNGNDSGRDYTFVCEGCGRRVTELSPGRIVYVTLLVVLGGGLGGMMVTFGIKMLASTLRDGAGGNSLTAVILVLVLFLGLGTPFLLLIAWVARSLLRDWLELRQNPVVR